MLEELTSAVQYRRTEGEFDRGWHTLAAFDVRKIAEKYRDDCARDGFEYRVVDVRD